MTYVTHKSFAIGWVLIGNVILYKLGMTEINYFLAMIIMLQVGKYGALFPDIDHTWRNVREKTAPNWIINKIIHLTGGRHRSWQTHSIDIVVCMIALSFVLPRVLLQKQMIDKVNFEVLSIVMVGFSLGWLSHIFSDMLTNAGVRLFCWRNFKVALVPKEFLGLRFNTGKEWESYVYEISKFINVAVGIFSILYYIYTTEIGKNIGNAILNIMQGIG